MNGQNGTERSDSSPIGAFPGSNDSPIGSRPRNNSPIGAFPGGNDSPIGSRPQNGSPIGAFPGGNDGPIGSRPRNGSPIGAFPGWNDSPIGSRPQNGSPIGAFPGGNDSADNGYRANDFGSARGYNTAEEYPPYEGSSQNGYSSYSGSSQESYPPYGSSQDGYYNGYNSGYEKDTAPAHNNVTDTGSSTALPSLSALPKLPAILLGSWIGLTAIATIVLLCSGEKWSIIFELFHLMPIVTAFIYVSRRNKLRTALIGIGVSTAFIIFTAIQRINLPKAFEWFSKNMTPNFILLLFTLAASLLLIVPRFSYNARLRRCTERVQAKIVRVDKQSHRTSKGHRTTTYNPTFEYTFRGMTYTSSENVYTNSYRPVEGHEAELFIDPRQPNYITDPAQHESGIVMFRFFGIFFYCMCIFAFFIQFLNG